LSDNREQKIKLEASWLAALSAEFEQPYMRELRQFLAHQKRQGKQIYPPGSQFFHAFDRTPLNQVKVVILGQDPYHGPGQAHGLCFSVPPGVRCPPSLVNIFKELQRDLGIAPPEQGHLTHWADQGVLLLNSVLSVEAGQAASHRGRGWEQFTDAAVAAVNQSCEHVVFMLWGSYAQAKGSHIDSRRHLVLKAPHPSPLSAHRGFLGCGHFSAANRYLIEHGRGGVQWDSGSA